MNKPGMRSMQGLVEQARIEAATNALMAIASYLRMKGHDALADELLAEFSDEVKADG